MGYVDEEDYWEGTIAPKGAGGELKFAGIECSLLTNGILEAKAS